MCSSTEELYERASWNGKGPISRQKLMDRLQCKYVLQSWLVICLFPFISQEEQHTGVCQFLVGTLQKSPMIDANI